MVGGKRKKALQAKGKATMVAKAARRGTKEERRVHKMLERRKKEKMRYTADMWAEPAPSHLVAKLDLPKLKSKHQSYFEFADNPEKRQKKLETQVTNDPPPPGFVFVPVGDPVLTNACKELSREKDAMIFIVSTLKEKNSKISEHVHRTGYHFREVIVDEAREIIGETVISHPVIAPGTVEPIPELQEEINKQADGAIRDLFPRIPNPDRVMIIEHAFKKGALFHGEPTVGLQANIPLSRRVQLAVLAHIRHTHTRYDKLLRETTWMNARKAVEPVCLDILIKWRGDEETGRDQMDEILREVVIITDSEDEDDTSEEDSTDEDGEITSVSSTEPLTQPNSRNQDRQPNGQMRGQGSMVSGLEAGPSQCFISSRTRGKEPKEKKEQRGFKRYQAAWDEAITRRKAPPPNTGTPLEDTRRPRSALANSTDIQRQLTHGLAIIDPPYVQPKPTGSLRSEVNAPHPDRPPYHMDLPRGQHATVPYQNASHRPGYSGYAPYSAIENGPPQVVRRSPTKHGLQDFLVPSIETGPSDVSPRRNEWHNTGAHDGPLQSRVIGHQSRTPVPRQVIVINDDSPPLKRRRLIHEGEPGHFRPVSSLDHSVYTPVSHSDFVTLKTASSIQSEVLDSNLVVRRPRPAQSAQGLSRDPQSFYTDPSTAERLPVYDAPESGFFAAHPGYLRNDGGAIPVHREQEFRAQPFESQYMSHDDARYRRAGPILSNDTTGMNGPSRHRPAQFEYSRRDEDMTTLTSGPSINHRPSHSHDMGAGAGGPDQNFIHSFSQSRLDGPPSDSRPGFDAISARHEQHDGRQRHPQYDPSARSFAPASSSLRQRSPVRYVERPLQYRELSHQPPSAQTHAARPDQYAPASQPSRIVQTRQMPLPEGLPTYVRTLPPKRQVIYLD